MKVKVKDNHNLVRDLDSTAILCKNVDVLKRHEQKIMELNEKEEQKKQINTLKRDVSDIKEMLQQIIQRLN